MLDEFIPLVNIDDPNRDEIITDYFCNRRELTFDNFIPLRMDVFITWLSTQAAWKCFGKHGYRKWDYGNKLLNIKANKKIITCHIDDDRDYRFLYITFGHKKQMDVDLNDPPPDFINMFVNENTISLHNYFATVLNSIKLGYNFKVIDSKNDMTAYISGNVKMIKTFLIKNDDTRTSKDVRELQGVITENIKKCVVEFPSYAIYTDNAIVDNSYIMKSNSEDILTCSMECEYKMATIEEWYKPGNPGYKSSEVSWTNHSSFGTHM